MYDRKTWIIVGLCAILLALNAYFAPKQIAAQAPQPPAGQSTAAPSQPLPSTPGQPAPTAGLEVVPPPAAVAEKLVMLETEKATFVLTTVGGGVKETRLKDEHQVNDPQKLVAVNEIGVPVATLLDQASLEPSAIVYAYDEAASVAGKSVVFLGKTASGLLVKKTFALADPQLAGSAYLLDFSLTVENSTAMPVALNNWSLALGTAAPMYQRETAQTTSFFWRHGDAYDYKDAAYFKGGFASSDKPSFETTMDAAEFTGVANQFFATVLRNNEAAQAQLWARPLKVNLAGGAESLPAVRAGVTLPAVSVAAGEQRTFGFQIFMGPKDNQLLRSMQGELGDIMNYGWFRWISRFLNWLLATLHGVFDGVSQKWSWGLAVVALTIVIRTLIWPLHAKSTRTMKRMSKLQPELKALKEKYPDDPQRMNQEMMKLYKKYSVNPLGGCLPMFLQIPIFFGFYRMLQYAVELRHQEFLWVKDLSQPDTMAALDIFGMHLPINVLPILMGITMVIQMKMTPQTGDAMQRRIMMLMPVMFLFFCYNFASALALYWTTQNIFSIGQTWLMNKMPEPELKSRTPGKKSWMEKLAERQAEMQKRQGQGGGNGGGNGGAAPTKKKRPPRTGG